MRYWLTTIGENAISDETVLLGDDEAEKPIEVAVQLLNQIIAHCETCYQPTSSDAPRPCPA